MLLVDTGPLVALLCERDSAHGVCTEASRHTSDSLLTTWPVVTEAAWLLRADPQNIQQLLRMITEGHLVVADLDVDAVEWIDAFFGKYSDQNPQLADASLMYLAESQSLDVIFTLDRRDFSIYRTTDNRALTLIP